MGKITTVKYICDCCGKESDSEDFNTGCESGSGSIEIKGSYGAKDAFGNWGGRTTNIKEELCFECMKTIENFYNTLKEA